jgi:hypothetical protein
MEIPPRGCLTSPSGAPLPCCCSSRDCLSASMAAQRPRDLVRGSRLASEPIRFARRLFGSTARARECSRERTKGVGAPFRWFGHKFNVLGQTCRRSQASVHHLKAKFEDGGGRSGKDGTLRHSDAATSHRLGPTRFLRSNQDFRIQRLEAVLLRPRKTRRVEVA